MMASARSSFPEIPTPGKKVPSLGKKVPARGNFGNGPQMNREHGSKVRKFLGKSIVEWFFITIFVAILHNY
jgi:hypothetical protein